MTKARVVERLDFQNSNRSVASRRLSMKLVSVVGLPNFGGRHRCMAQFFDCHLERQKNADLFATRQLLILIHVGHIALLEGNN